MASLKVALTAGIVTFILIACVVVVVVVVVEAGDKPQKLQIDVTKKVENCDRRSKVGDSLHMHYTGTLEDGTKFDSSIPRGKPFVFTLGAGQVIKGWDEGLLDMCVGEKRKLLIPSDLGYGDRGSPPKIPGGATLVFEVELMKIDQRKEGFSN